MTQANHYPRPIPTTPRRLSRLDRWLGHLDHARLTLSDALPQRRPAPQPDASPNAPSCEPAQTPSTAPEYARPSSTPPYAVQIAACLRINHTGEVCAQALYLGQASQAATDDLAEHLLNCAEEEEAHLQWCANRLHDLGATPSRFNAVWYALSFALGVAVARWSDRLSLSFVHATENQVKRHLQEHLDFIGEHDPITTTLLAEMLREENEHAASALAKGGIEFPAWIQSVMWKTSRVMAWASRRA